MIEYMRDVEALALNIYYEARGESVMGKYAVAHATLNRVTDPRWPDTVFEVVWQKWQFSWTNAWHGTIMSVEGRQLAALEDIREEQAFKQALVIASTVLAGGEEDFTGGANHYNTLGVDPAWDDDMELTLIVGDHEFFRG